MIRIAMLGCDSTHTEAYGSLTNGEQAPLSPRARIVSIWGAEPEVETEKARALGIDRVETTVEAAIEGADAILIINRFGEERFELAQSALQAGKPVFADKPITMDLDEAHELVNAYATEKIPLFSSSAFRFAEDTQRFRQRLKKETVIGGVVTGPFECTDLGDDPRLRNIFFYGIHLSELLQEVFGSGFDSVSVSSSKKHGYLATVRFKNDLQVCLALLKPMSDYYSVTAFTEAGTLSYILDLGGDYYLRTLGTFLDFIEGTHPGVPPKDTVEALELLFAVEEAARTGSTIKVGR